MSESNIITLTTDFGISDPYVGIMRGVILSINPKAKIIDITHSIPPQNIISAGFTIKNSFSFFPEKTIHLVVVDPGVGSKRSPILIKTEKYFFIGPDNGLFSSIISNEKIENIIEITNKNYFLKKVSRTFHGRDIFAPVTAHLSTGKRPDTFGSDLKNPIITPFPEPCIVNSNEAEGEVIHIDRFGNLLTNISTSFIEKVAGTKSFYLEVNNIPISKIVPYYAAAEDDELFCIIGSSDMLEISIKNSNAQKSTLIKRGDKVRIIYN